MPNSLSWKDNVINSNKVKKLHNMTDIEKEKACDEIFEKLSKINLDHSSLSKKLKQLRGE